jgi:hypothetical protein
MDAAIISAASGLAGSLIGGMSTLAAALLAQRGQLRAQMLVNEAAKRESLYAEFISEASARLTEAWGHQAENPEVIARLYAAVERMRLISSAELVQAARQVLQQVVEAYAAPDRSFAELRERLRGNDGSDPLQDFSEACRRELGLLSA